MADDKVDDKAQASEQPPVMDGVAEAEIRQSRRSWPSIVWLVPLLAAAVAISMVVSAWVSKGPEIVISFATAEGLVAGKTEVKYKNVVIGKVSDISLSDDRAKVLVSVELDNSAKHFATEQSRFWVVKPRISLGGVSGLGTLVSGAYIGADTEGDGKRQKHFTGLETPPPLTRHEKGTQFSLETDDLGSLNIGSPVYYRRIQVGRVVAYQLNDDGKGVTMQIFVTAPYDKFVTTDARFWNASGVNLSLDATGLTLNTESLATLVAGGVAFLSPDNGDQQPASNGSGFTLFENKSLAMSPKDGSPLTITMEFDQSLRGLDVGAPVDFRGITLGKVTKVSLGYNAKKHRFPAKLTAQIYPTRLGEAHKRFVEKASNASPESLLALLVNYGLRAQLRKGNLLTGKLYVALDFFPNAAKVELPEHETPLVMPSVSGKFDHFQEQLGDIVDKLQGIPFDRIGQHLDGSLKSLNALLQQLQSDVSPQVTATLEQTRNTLKGVEQVLSDDSPLAGNMDNAMEQISRAARSLRDLTDYLARHPEALLRGKPSQRGQSNKVIEGSR